MKLRFTPMVLIGVAVVLGICFALFHPYSLHPTRYGQLKCAINRNTGFAHMTRGMNMNTINALHREAGSQDIPVLIQMLDDRDRVTQMTAAQTLARMGEPGLQALRQELTNMGRQTGANFYRYDAVQEAIADVRQRAGRREEIALRRSFSIIDFAVRFFSS